MRLTEIREDNRLWLRDLDFPVQTVAALSTYRHRPNVYATEQEVGEVMYRELIKISNAKSGDIVVIMLGGRGAQALYSLLREKVEEGDPEGIIRRLVLFTQDALAPLSPSNPFNFVADFRRLLGDRFFAMIKGFHTFDTGTASAENAIRGYLNKLSSYSQIDLFLLGHGPEPEDSSHLCYIKPGSGAHFNDLAGAMPIYASVLNHHISKFKAGGVSAEEQQESEVKAAKNILTLGPGLILKANRIIQSIVDADTAPAKKKTFRKVLDTELSHDADERQKQLDENPGLWIRLNPNVLTLVTKSLLES